MASVMDNKEFSNSLFSAYPIDKAEEWIKHNMNPEDIFSEDQLILWAEENGYVKETENEK